jgi:AcrR family transcriptional regulator
MEFTKHRPFCDDHLFDWFTSEFAVAPTGGSSRDRILQAAKSLFASKGYDYTSTIAIARLAGTSESQLIKHFGSKEGSSKPSSSSPGRGSTGASAGPSQRWTPPADKFHALVDLTLTALTKDSELNVLLLLEGRHIRKSGQMILLDQDFMRLRRTTRVESQVVANKVEMDTKDLAR